jgi:ATP-dependent DNA helicase RecG
MAFIMNKIELLNIIKNGENSYIEFKEENIKNKELAEEFVAFANGEGGTVLIGISMMEI